MKNKGFWLFKLARGSPGHGKEQFWEILAASLFGSENARFGRSRRGAKSPKPRFSKIAHFLTRGGFKLQKPFVFQRFFQPEPGPGPDASILGNSLALFPSENGRPGAMPPTTIPG